jgi:hypothetical protein
LGKGFTKPVSKRNQFIFNKTVDIGPTYLVHPKHSLLFEL